MVSVSAFLIPQPRIALPAPRSYLLRSETGAYVVSILDEPYLLSGLLTRHAAPGRLDWIGIRPARHEPLLIVDEAEITESGLVGDHRANPGKRAVTLIQAEHIPVIAALSGHEEILPEVLRRNLVISRLNLGAIRRGKLRIGPVLLSLTGPCAPCSRMEKLLGFGGFNAMRGHGGWTAEVLEPGKIRIGDEAMPEA